MQKFEILMHRPYNSAVATSASDLFGSLKLDLNGLHFASGREGNISRSMTCCKPTKEHFTLDRVEAFEHHK
jgi:hypothetical protein